MKKNTRSADFRADQIDVITNFAVITNVVKKRIHCMQGVFFSRTVGKTVYMIHEII